MTAADVIDEADKALYRAKRTGGTALLIKNKENSFIKKQFSGNIFFTHHSRN